MAQIPILKAFVSEKEIEEVKKKRQEEWEKVRKPDQPLQCPEPEYDPRTLYEKLKEQKDRKQEEWEDQFKFKNMIYKGLDDDESRFLNFVADQQAQQKTAMQQEEMQELSDFREAVAKLHDEAASTAATTAASDKTPPSEDSSRNPKVTSPKPPSLPSKTQKSQLSLIAGSIRTKRKRSDSQDVEKCKSVQESPTEKKPRVEPDHESTADRRTDTSSRTAAPTATLPGLSVYSSSDSDSDGDTP